MWGKKVSTYCDYFYGGWYENFEEAKEACKKDSNCAAIYARFCNTDFFRLCATNYTELEPSYHCIYIKLAGTVTIKLLIMNI